MLGKPFSLLVMYKIYLITNQKNGKKYIGLTSKSLSSRLKSHIQDARRDTERHLQRAIRKHGKESFKIEEIEKCKDEEKAKEREKYWISEYNTYKGKGYNLTAGGEKIGSENIWNKGKSAKEYDDILGKEKAEAYTNKISKAHKGKVLEESTKKKIGKSNRGEKNGMYGKTPWNKGKELSEETKSKLAKSKGELTENKVREIKWLLKNSKLTQSEIGNLYGIGRKSISNISTEKCWKFIQSTKLPCFLAVADYEANFE